MATSPPAHDARLVMATNSMNSTQVRRDIEATNKVIAMEPVRSNPHALKRLLEGMAILQGR
jgi:hypothetical protein